MNKRVRWLLYSPTRLWTVVGAATAVLALFVVGYFLAPSATPAAATAAPPASTGAATPTATPPSGTPTTGQPEDHAAPTSAGLDQAALSSATDAVTAYTRAWLSGSGPAPQGLWLAQLQPFAGHDLLAEAEAMTRASRDRIPHADITRLEFTAATPAGAVTTVILTDGTKLQETAVPSGENGKWVVTEVDPLPRAEPTP